MRKSGIGQFHVILTVLLSECHDLLHHISALLGIELLCIDEDHHECGIGTVVIEQILVERKAFQFGPYRIYLGLSSGFFRRQRDQFKLFLFLILHKVITVCDAENTVHTVQGFDLIA